MGGLLWFVDKRHCLPLPNTHWRLYIASKAAFNNYHFLLENVLRMFALCLVLYRQEKFMALLLGGNLHKCKKPKKCIKNTIFGAKTAIFLYSPSWTILEPFATRWQARF
jgi:hypothetical protein